MLAEGLFVKALQNLETGELLNNSLCGKLVSSLVSQKTFQCPDFNLLSCDLDNFMCKILYLVTLY